MFEEYEPIIDLLDDVFGEHRNHNEYSGQLTYCCPVCSYEIKQLDKPDEKYNLEINYKLNVGKCWACSETHDTHGTIYSLIKKFGTTRQLKKFEILSPNYDNTINKKNYKKVKLPKEFMSFKSASAGLKLTHYYKSAYNYLKSRHVSDETITRYNIGFCYEGLYQNRIIIPSYDNDGDLNYFTARSIETKPKLKYRNPEAEKDVIIFNEHLINWELPIYIVEGPFDSLFLSNSIPMLGKKMSDYLFDKLYNNAKKIIIVLDGDAYQDSEKLYYKLNGGKLFGKIWLTKLPIDKDIADLEGNLSDYPPFQLN